MDQWQQPLEQQMAAHHPDSHSSKKFFPSKIVIKEVTVPVKGIAAPTRA